MSFIASAILIAVFMLTARTGYHDTKGRAEREAHGLLEASVSYIGNQLRLWNLVLDLAARELEQSDDLGRSQAETLTYVARQAGYVGSLLVLDEQGDIVADPMGPAPRTGNFADRDYFRVHLDRSDAGTFISEPFRSRLRGGDPSIALSRRLSAPDGSFAGIVMIAVRLESVRLLFDQLSLGPGDVISLLSPRGRLLARKPLLDRPGDFGLDLADSPVFLKMHRERSGSFTARASTDGVERLFAFNHVPGTGLLLSVGLATSDIFANWWRRNTIFGVFTLLTCAGAVWLAFRLKAELVRRNKAERRLNELAVTDGLTGLPNRRRFDELLHREWRRASRTGAPLSLVMLDADHFKQLNDTYGHAVGDAILKCLADTITAALRRPGDVGARYGGEEFALILPDTLSQGAVHLAEGILAQFQAATAALGRPCTASAGVSSFDGRRPQSLTEMLSGADAALYQAKAEGRNRVRVDGTARLDAEASAGGGLS